jgi:hypothetical protein
LSVTQAPPGSTYRSVLNSSGNCTNYSAAYSVPSSYVAFEIAVDDLLELFPPPYSVVKK